MIAESLTQINEEQLDQLFVQRTNYHISLVKQNLLLMKGYLGLSIDALQARANEHDNSKFSEPERTAYRWITWKYNCQHRQQAFHYSDDIQQQVLTGWQHHITQNAHHPEYHRDPNQMSNLDMVEMVCDWMAISQELQQKPGSCRAWAEENMDKKWCFSESMKNTIYSTIDELEKRVAHG